MVYLLVAVDDGPRETLLPLAAACNIPLEDVASPQCADDEFWRQCLDSRHADLLVVGTSDSAPGRRIEAAARRAANAARLRIVAIEDFPGNYGGVEEGDASLVIVESALARELYLRRLAERAVPVEVLSLARYDAYRERLDTLRDATAARWRAADGALCVLWAGQPETQANLRTLDVLLSLLRAHDVRLLFKAHPRDPGYADGVYEAVLQDARVAFEDLTKVTVAGALEAAPQLVATQFSSLAVEAGFHGIPSLCILLPDAGGNMLEQKKGHAVPLFCAAGGAAFATDAREAGAMFARTLSDTAFRNELIAAFDRYFEVNEVKTPALLERLQSLVEK